MIFGYARVSTQEQLHDLQLDALAQANCNKIFTDKISGTVADRPGLSKLKEQLRKGDTLVIWRLDRLFRSLKHLIEWVNFLDKEVIGLKCLHENIDTSTAGGKFFFHICGAMSEFESSILRDRTQHGLSAARSRGRFGERPKSLNKDKIQLAICLYNEKKMNVAKICELMGITKPTLYKYLQAERVNSSVSSDSESTWAANKNH